MRISEVAGRTGVLATTIRFYESIGLLPPPHRQNGHRVYGTDVLDRLTLIRFGQNAGFSLKELKSLFQCFSSRAKRRNAAQGELKELKNQRDRIKLMEKAQRDRPLSLRHYPAGQRAFDEVRRTEQPILSSSKAR